MLNLVYEIVKTLINKENNGYLSPTELNLLANLVQLEIIREYFDDENRDKIKENKGYTNKGYSNLDFNKRQLITKLAGFQQVSKVSGKFILPTDTYFVEDDGITTTDGNVIEEVERSKVAYLVKSSGFDKNYPVYEKFGTEILVYPDNITQVNVKYIKYPKPPVWTYVEVQGKEQFNPSNPSFQDFVLHESELPNIVIRMMQYFSINIREKEIVEIAQMIKDRTTSKENS